eukprot:2766376-Pyramimonas_sp.AAC.1
MSERLAETMGVPGAGDHEQQKGVQEHEQQKGVQEHQEPLADAWQSLPTPERVRRGQDDPATQADAQQSSSST